MLATVGIGALGVVFGLAGTLAALYLGPRAFGVGVAIGAALACGIGYLVSRLVVVQ